MKLSNKRMTKALIRLRGCTGWSAPLFSQTTEDRLSRVKTHIVFVIGGVKFIIQAVMVIWYQLGG